jgi:hypothetical protein
MQRKFDGKDGKVVFFDLGKVSVAYPEGTIKFEVKIYPAAQVAILLLFTQMKS